MAIPINSKEFQTGADPNTSPNKKGGHHFSKGAIAGIAGLAITITAGLGIGSSISSAENAKAESTPTKTEDVSANVQKDNEIASLKSSVEALTPSMASYEAMSITAFDSLPRQERVAYAQYLIDKTRASGEYEQIYFGEYEKLKKEYIEPSINNSGQEILDSWVLDLQYAAGQHIDKQAKNDILDAEKLLSIPYLYVGEEGTFSKDFNKTETFLESLNTWNPYSKNLTEIETSDTVAYNYDSNTAMSAKIIKFSDNNDNNKIEYAEFVLTKIPEKNNAVKYAWSLISLAPTMEELQASVDRLNANN